MPNEDRDWMSVIARSFAFLCLHFANLRDKGFVPQAELLEGLGLTRQESAQLLGTSADSLSALFRQQRPATKKRGNGKGKGSKANSTKKSKTSR